MRLPVLPATHSFRPYSRDGILCIYILCDWSAEKPSVSRIPAHLRLRRPGPGRLAASASVIAVINADPTSVTNIFAVLLKIRPPCNNRNYAASLAHPGQFIPESGLGSVPIDNKT